MIHEIKKYKLSCDNCNCSKIKEESIDFHILMIQMEHGDYFPEWQIVWKIKENNITCYEPFAAIKDPATLNYTGVHLDKLLLCRECSINLLRKN